MRIRDPQLDAIAAQLEGLEETIIARLIDRAQFHHNAVVYQAGASGFAHATHESLFELRLRYQEEMDARFGRFMVPEERPFNTDLPCPQRTVSIPDTGLPAIDYNCINLTSRITPRYLELVARFCQPGDDGQYGSSVEHDVAALQALSRRIHYAALYIAESKYTLDVATYNELIRNRDTGQMMRLLTRREIEERIIERVRQKVVTLQASANSAVRFTIDPKIVCDLFRETIIPMTKEGEIRYLLNRPRDDRQ